MGSKIFLTRLLVVLFFSVFLINAYAGIFSLFDDNPKFIILEQDANFSDGNICDLNNVVCTSEANNQVLVFQTSTQTWINAMQAGGGGGGRTYTGLTPVSVNNDTNVIALNILPDSDWNGLFDGNNSTFYIDWTNSVNRLFSLLTLDDNSSFDDRYSQIDTNAETACSAGEVLFGDGTCGTAGGPNLLRTYTGISPITTDNDTNQIGLNVLPESDWNGTFDGFDINDFYLLIGTQGLTNDFNLGTSSQIDFNFSSDTVLRLINVSNASNFLVILNAPLPDGVPGSPVITVDGGSTNQGFILRAKGTGVIQSDSNIFFPDNNALIFRDNQLGIYSPIDGELDIFADQFILLDSSDVNASNSFSSPTIRVTAQYTFPTTDGSAGQVIQTDGAGVLTFEDGGGGGGSSQYSAGGNIVLVTADNNAFNFNDGNFLGFTHNWTANQIFNNDISLIFGEQDDAEFVWTELATNNYFGLALDLGSTAFTGQFILLEDEDVGKEFEVIIQDNPTLNIRSADENKGILFYHNQLNPFFTTDGDFDTYDFNAPGKGIRSVGGFLEADFNGPQSFIRKGLVINDNGDVDLNAIFRVEGGTDQNLLASDPVNNRIGIGTGSPNELLDVNAGGSVGIIGINGDGGGCLKIEDTDNLGFTFCTALNGVLSCSSSAC